MATMNLALRFLVELAGIAAIGYAGFQIAAPMPVPAIAGIGAALAFIVTWWLVVAPNTTNGLSHAQKDLVGTALLLVAAGALAVAGQPGLAVALAAIVVINATLLLVVGEDARQSLAGMAR
jgi:hypothetical protein